MLILGYAAGHHWRRIGGGSNLLCLPEEPQLQNHTKPGVHSGYLYGIEYRTDVPNLPGTPRTMVNRLHARSAMYLSDQPSWWSRPVTSVQLAGHVSTTDIWWRSIPMRLILWRPGIKAPATSVLTQLLKSQLDRSTDMMRLFISSESAVELCRVPNLPKVSTCRVWCAPNDNYWLRSLMITADINGIHLLYTYTYSSGQL